MKNCAKKCKKNICQNNQPSLAQRSLTQAMRMYDKKNKALQSV